MDNRNFKRNDRGPVRQRSAMAAFIDKNGIYLVMLVCLALIGVTAYFTLGTNDDQAAQPTPTASQQSAAANQNNGTTLQDEMNRLQQIANATPTPTATPAPTVQPTATPKAQQTVNTVKPVQPVKGEILRPYSDKDPVYFQTLNAWMIHKATDIQADEGTAVLAMLDGTVESVTNDAETGYTIVIKHANDVKSTYGNLQAPESIKKGQEVKQGETIGAVGKSANNTASDPAHLHFAVSVKGVAKDPMTYLEGK